MPDAATCHADNEMYAIQQRHYALCGEIKLQAASSLWNCSDMCLCLVQAFDMQELCEVAVKLHQLNSSWSDVKKASYVKHAVREYKIHRQLK